MGRQIIRFRFIGISQGGIRFAKFAENFFHRAHEPERSKEKKTYQTNSAGKVEWDFGKQRVN